MKHMPSDYSSTLKKPIKIFKSPLKCINTFLYIDKSKTNTSGLLASYCSKLTSSRATMEICLGFLPRNLFNSSFNSNLQLIILTASDKSPNQMEKPKNEFLFTVKIYIN